MTSLLVSLTQALLCFLTMALTALFALSLALPSGLSPWHDALAIGLMLALGVAMDLSKFLFWHQRHRHRAFFVLSLSLLVFSFAASIAFLVSQEQQITDQAQGQTAAHSALQARIDGLNQIIAQKEQLARLRLDSRYHEQWDKGEPLAEEIHLLAQERARLLSDRATVGREQARRTTPSGMFFTHVSDWLGWSFDAVMIIAYAALAGFIEVSALGMISLRQSLSLPRSTSAERNTPPAKPRDVASAKAQLKHDVGEGKIPPVIRKLIRLYGLRYPVVKALLDELVKEGALIKHGRVYQKAKP